MQSSAGWNLGIGKVILTWPPATGSAAPTPGSVTFSTPTTTAWSVPTGVTSIEVDIRGAQSSGGGYGGRTVATLPVTSGEALMVNVGSSDGTWGGGGSSYLGNPGGGGSDLREGGSLTANRIVVAGGGGGSGQYSGSGTGGSGGGTTGQAGGGSPCAGSGGGGGTQSAGGGGGSGAYNNGAGGALVSGGQGGSGYTFPTPHWGSGGGGGGGYYGGGGGGSCAGQLSSGGGGGSNYTESTATQVLNFQGWQVGNGKVTIAWPSFQAVGGALASYELMANNPSSNYCPVCHGDPIDTATGGLAETISDLSVPGRGVPLDFTHSYNSLMAPTNSPLGYGWTDSYNMSLTLGSGSPPVTATVNQENGTQVSFSVSGTVYTAPPRVLATLVHNGDGTFTFTRRATQIFQFDSSGRLTAEQDLNGYSTTLTYDGSGHLSTVTDPAGRTLGITWTGSHITSVTDTASPARTVTFGYNDGDGNLTDAVDAAGGHTFYTYDSSHRLLTMRAPKYYGDTTTSPSPVTTNHYNSDGQIDWQTDPMGHQTSFAYTGTSTSITDPNGNVEVEQYRYGILVADTKGYGTAQAANWTYAYDPSTLGLTSVTDPNGNTSSFTYDANGNRLTATNPRGSTTTTTYNALNEPLTAVDALGVTTTMAYDANGNLLSTATPLVGSSPAVTQTVSYGYGDSGHPGDVTAMTDPNSNTSAYSYDVHGDLAAVTDTAGDETTFAYDAIGRRTSMVSPNGNMSGGTPSAHTSSYTYDALGRVLTQVDPLGNTPVTNVYDHNGNVTSTTDALGNVTTMSYNADNKVTLITRADTTTLANGYDADGNEVTQTDGAGHSTTYAFADAALPGKATSMTDPNGRTTIYAYDGAGNLVSKQDSGGNCSATPKTGCTTYGYDAASEQVSTSYSDGVTPNVTGTVYDADGRRTSVWG